MDEKTTVSINGANWTLKDSILYKLDRTLAVLGIICLGGWALYIGSTESSQIGMAAISGLVGYIGGRATTK